MHQQVAIEYLHPTPGNFSIRPLLHLINIDFDKPAVEEKVSSFGDTVEEQIDHEEVKKVDDLLSMDFSEFEMI